MYRSMKKKLFSGNGMNRTFNQTKQNRKKIEQIKKDDENKQTKLKMSEQKSKAHFKHKNNGNQKCAVYNGIRRTCVCVCVVFFFLFVLMFALCQFS